MRRCSGFLALSLSSLLLLAGLTGCGGFVTQTVIPPTTGNTQMEGTVYSGKTPVSGAQVRLYVAGSTGNASAATDLSGTGSTSTAAYTTTAADGTFSLAGSFTCPTATSSFTPEVYLVATGGNPGLSSSVNNTSLVLVDALGPCASLASTTKTSINELTTVAAAWALSGFMSSATSVGASATNSTGLANAFLNAQLIADPALGTTPGSALASTNTIETGKVAALANAIATCSGSDGSTACQTLFTTTGQCSSTCTSDTLSAALYAVKHPAKNVAALYALGSKTAPFTSSLTAAPNDWTLSMTLTGGGITYPTELAVDSVGNVWVAGYYGAVYAYTPQGNTLSGASGFGKGTLGSEIFGLAIDTHNNVWVTVEEHPSSISGLNGISSGNTLGSLINISGLTYVSSNYLYFPESASTAQNGNIIVGNYGDATYTVFNYTPAAGFVYGVSNGGIGYVSGVTDETGDASGGVWTANSGNDTVAHFDSAGNVLSNPTCCNIANGIATDSIGNAWVSNYYTNSLSEILPGCDSNSSSSASCHGNPQNVILFGDSAGCTSTLTPTAGTCGLIGGGLSYPSKIIVDAAQNVWVANYQPADVGLNATVSEFAGNTSTTPGTALSPSTVRNSSGTVTAAGGYGLDAKLLDPFDLAPDASGNLWVSNNGYNNVVMFFGLTAPTATPRLPTPAAP
ncbi:NHL repeat-containing protein [Granulicella paludicola]|uniref:hypothetical protein n=1 Tax=Granulicella paludicola TaxID=474951 RepID=UPI0021DF5D99|nr:hypothetical protein [Granulicella paludicola]